MTLTTTTHLNFRGQAREAMDAYAAVFGGEVVAFTNAQAGYEGEGAVPDHVIWAGLEAPCGLRLMGFDVPPERAFDRGRDAVYVSVRGDDPEEITRFFEALAADGGTVRQALGPAGWASLYGMVDDRFGVTWVLDVLAQG